MLLFDKILLKWSSLLLSQINHRVTLLKAYAEIGCWLNINQIMK